MFSYSQHIYLYLNLNHVLLSHSRKFFMDAMPLVATTDSAKFMFELISRNEISQSESSIWLTSLSFISEPTAGIVSVFTVSDLFIIIFPLYGRCKIKCFLSTKQYLKNYFLSRKTINHISLYTFDDQKLCFFAGY